MANKSRALKEAFSKKERAVSLLVKLQKMKSEGSLTEEQFQSMKAEYDQMIDSSTKEIDRLKGEINSDLQSVEKEVESYKQELSNLSLRQKVGEISANEFQKSEKKLKGKIEKAEGEITALKALASAQLASDIAGTLPTTANLPSTSMGSKGSMTIGNLFSRAFELYKENPIIVIPSILPLVWLALFGVFIYIASMSFEGAFQNLQQNFSGYRPSSDIEMMYEIIKALMGWIVTIAVGSGIFLIGLIAIQIVAQGMTIEMVRDASGGSRADLSSAWTSTKGKLMTLVVAAIVVSELLFVQYMLLIIPGLILSLLLYFVVQTIMIDDKGALESLGASYNFVKANFADSVIIVLISLVIWLLPGMHLPFYLGHLLHLVAMPYIIALSTLLYIDRR